MKKITIAPNRTVVKITIHRKDNYPDFDPHYNNIYLVNDDYEIIWQVFDPNGHAFPQDPFHSLDLNEQGEIIGYRWSGFTYKINPNTGETTFLAFHK